MENDTLTRTPSGTVNNVAKKMEMARRLLAQFVPVERTGKENLYLTRHDIRFETVAPGRVHIEVTVHNRGDGASKPTQAILRSAPLGAFLAWTPLTRVDVPSIPARSEHVVQVDAEYDRNEGLNRMARLPSARAQLVESSSSGLEGTGNWIGNIDVHVKGAYAEKHCAGGRLAYGARKNVAIFSVGDGRPDRYRFEWSIRCPGGPADWGVELNRLNGGDLSLPIANEYVILRFTPPAGVTKALLEVVVTRSSTGAEAVVEFQVSTP